MTPTHRDVLLCLVAEIKRSLDWHQRQGMKPAWAPPLGPGQAAYLLREVRPNLEMLEGKTLEEAIEAWREESRQ